MCKIFLDGHTNFVEQQDRYDDHKQNKGTMILRKTFDLIVTINRTNAFDIKNEF